MHSVVVLDDIELIPVLQFEPSAFAADDRPGPSGRYQDIPEEWYPYWLESLADSGITGLVPIQRGSWHVATREFTDLAPLRKVLEVIFQKLSEKGFVDQPDGTPLLGGLALRSQSQNVLIEPTCCADLGNVADWRKAAAYRQAEWRTLWIGHPWLSVRYHGPQLIIGDPFEDKNPVARWAACPDQVQVAVAAAEVELERFSRHIAEALPPGYDTNANLMGRKLAGLG